MDKLISHITKVHSHCHWSHNQSRTRIMFSISVLQICIDSHIQTPFSFITNHHFAFFLLKIHNLMSLSLNNKPQTFKAMQQEKLTNSLHSYMNRLISLTHRTNTGEHIILKEMQQRFQQSGIWYHTRAKTHRKTENKYRWWRGEQHHSQFEQTYQPHTHLWLTLCFNPSAAHHPKMLAEVPVGGEIKAEEGQQRTEEGPKRKEEKEERGRGWAGNKARQNKKRRL